MEQLITERIRRISQVLAAIPALMALWTAYAFIQYLFGLAWPKPAGEIVFDIIVITFMVVLFSLCIWLAVRFWAGIEQKHVKGLAFAAALTAFSQISVWLTHWQEQIIHRYWPAVDSNMPLVSVDLFLALLAAGIIYVACKRLLFRLLDRTELVDPVEFCGNRKHYFKWLSFFLFGAILSIFQLVDEMGHIDIYKDWWFPFTALLIPVLTAVIFYKLCAYLFVTRPLKNLQPEQSTFRLRSQP